MDKVTGKVLGNPTGNLPDGVRMSFGGRRLRKLPPDGLSEVPDLSSFDGICLAVCGQIDDASFVRGTAALLGPGIAVTAKHVIEDIAQAAGWRDGNRRLTLLGPGDTGLTIWSTTRVEMLNNSDIAILSLRLSSKLPSDYTLRVCEMALTPPKVGERVCLAGFRATQPQFEATPMLAEMSLNLYASVGVVTEVYPHGRDRHLLPAPCFQVETGAVGGMSGGPVFGADGRVIGVVSTSYEGGPSFVSLIGPFINQPLVSVWPEGLYTSPMSLRERARVGHVFLSER